MQYLYFMQPGEEYSERRWCPGWIGVLEVSSVAKETYRTERKAGMSPGAAVVLGALLILPIVGALHLPGVINLWYLLGYAVGISGMTILVYRHDKIRAQKEGWRTPESTLHFLELLGGWPGAFLAQRLFWHKISKRSFQVEFWGIVVVYQAVCFDFLNGWHYSRALVEAVRQGVKSW